MFLHPETAVSTHWWVAAKASGMWQPLLWLGDGVKPVFSIPWHFPPPWRQGSFFFKPSLHYPLHHYETCNLIVIGGLEKLLLFWSIWAYYVASVLNFFFLYCNPNYFLFLWGDLGKLINTIDWTFFPHSSLLFKLPQYMAHSNLTFNSYCHQIFSLTFI